MKTWKTPKGTDLILIQLKGKDYLQVAQRLIWFREERPLWSIKTEFLLLEEDVAIAKAEILDESGRIISTGHKREDKQHFADHLEKAEAGAIGRALAYIGYGTQFCAEDLDEGGRIVDAPQEPKSASETKGPGDFKITKAKKEWEGLTIKQVVDRIGLPQFQKDVDWWATSSSRNNTPEIKLLNVNCERYTKLLAGQGGDGKPQS